MCNSYESRSVSARAESYKKVRKQIYIKILLPPHVFWDPGSGMGKNPDPGSGINILDPQHCLEANVLGGKRPWRQTSLETNALGDNMSSGTNLLEDKNARDKTSCCDIVKKLDLGFITNGNDFAIKCYTMKYTIAP